MSISGFDLNLLHRPGADRPTLFVVVAADTVCSRCEDLPPVVQTWPMADIDRTEGYPSRASGAPQRSGYDGAWFSGPVGARIDLSC